MQESKDLPKKMESRARATELRQRVFRTFKPTGSLVALEVFILNELMSGLILPDGTENPEVTPMARVIACGPDCKWVKEDDIVVCAKSTAGVNVVHGGSGKVMVLLEENIIGISEVGLPDKWQ